MTLKAEFNANYEATKVNDTVLMVTYDTATPNRSYKNMLIYDFTARVMILRTEGHGDGGATVTPFSQLDRESLVEMHDKLVALKGKPPELPREKPATTAKVNKLDL